MTFVNLCDDADHAHDVFGHNYLQEGTLHKRLIFVWSTEGDFLFLMMCVLDSGGDFKQTSLQ
jgi:hypothetical protein